MFFFNIWIVFNILFNLSTENKFQLGGFDILTPNTEFPAVCINLYFILLIGPANDILFIFIFSCRDNWSDEEHCFLTRTNHNNVYG